MQNNIGPLRALTCAAVLLALLQGCASGGSGSSTPAPTPSPTPTPTAAPIVISGIAPANIPVGSADFSVTVTGSGFVSGAVVSLNNTAEQTTYVSATELHALVPAAQVKSGAVLTVGVAANGNAVQADPTNVALSVDNPVPTFSAISPAVAALGGPDTTVTVTGTNFVQGVALSVNGTPRASTFVSDTQFTAKLSASDFAAAGALPLNVINPKPGGGTSGTRSFAVNNPAPVITKLSPQSISAGSAATTVTVSGSGFLPSAVLQVNGATHPATVVDGGQLTFSLSAGELANAATLAITVANPAPGGGSSSPLSFEVTSSSPNATSISPSTIVVGSAATVVTVNGTGFVPTSVVQFGTTAHATTYVSGTQLTFALAATELATAGSYPVVVKNPGSAVASQPVNLVVQPATPEITSLSQTNFVTTTGPLTFSVYGNNLTADSKVLWNGKELAATYGFNYSYFGVGYALTATVTGDLLTTTGTASITVTTPGAAAASKPVTVTISNPIAPTVTGLVTNAVPTGATVTEGVGGTDFTPNSVISYNGTPLPTKYSSSTMLFADIPANLLSAPGTGSVTVSTPAPGGGTSPAYPLTVYVPIVSNNMVFNPVNGLAYLSIPSTGSQVTGNSIVSFDPGTGALGTPLYVGSEPGVMAVSDDGKTLWVALNGTSAIRKVDLVHNVAGDQYSLGDLVNSNTTLTAMLVLPGSTNSVVVTNGYQLGLYDSGVLRGSAVSAYSIYALQADASRSELYAGGNSLLTFTYSSNGLTAKSTGTSSYNSPVSSGLDDMQLGTGQMFTDTGNVYDPESGALLGSFKQGTNALSGPALYDPALSQVYILNNGQSYYYGGYSQVSLFNPSDYSALGKSFTWNIPSNISDPTNPYNYTYLAPHHLTRWGANGLMVHTRLAMFTIQSNLIKDQSGVSADLSVTLTNAGGTTTGGVTTYTATVKNAGPKTATDVSVALQAPSTGIIQSTDASVGACSSTSGCTLGSLTSGSTATITIKVLQTTAGTGSLNATVQASSNDPAFTDNTAASSVTVTGDTYNLVPALLSVTPNSVKAGSVDTTITVTGSNFASGSQIKLGSKSLTTTFVSSSQLTATVPATSLANLGWSTVSVSTPSPGGGSSNALPLTVYNVITVGLNHVVYEPYSRKLYASVSSGSSTVTGSSVVSIDPATGTFGTPLTFDAVPNALALSTTGNTLYTSLATQSGSTQTSVPLGRIDLLKGTSKSISLPLSSYTYSYGSNGAALAIQPGSDSTLAVATTYGSIALYDYSLADNSSKQRPDTTNYSNNCFTFLDASDLFTGGSYTSYVYPVTASGFGAAVSLSGFSYSSCVQVNGKVGIDSYGKVYNITPTSASQTGTIVLPSTGSSLAGIPDPNLGEAFVAGNTTSTYYGSADGLLSYDLHSYVRSNTLNLNMPTVEGSPYSFYINDLIRWGQDGLALVTSTGHLYLLRGPFVVPQELNANSKAVLSSSSASTITAGTGNTLLKLTGSNFLPGVAVNWNGSYRTTTIVDATHVTVAIPASDLATAGTAKLTAVNPGAAASSAVSITIQ